MAKKKFIPNTVSVELPEDVPEVKKEKRVMSDKQKDNLKKGMAALKAKRESLAKEQEEESYSSPNAALVPLPNATPTPVPNATLASAPIEKKERKSYVKKSYVGVEEFNNFKNELLTTLKPRETIIEKPIDRIVDRVVEKVVEKPVDKYLSGSELLNRIFFK